MKIAFKDGYFHLKCDYSDNALARRAGFSWDNKRKVWVTPFASVVQKIAGVAGPELQDLIKQKLIEEQDTQLASKASSSDIEVPCPEGHSYLPYQIAGIASMRLKSSILLGDQMGLGKTVQAIGLSNLLADRTKSVLTVCPASLQSSWINHWREWDVKGLTVGQSIKEMPLTDITVMSYARAYKFKNQIRNHEWDLVIVDECHKLKNPKAQRTIAIYGNRNPKVGKFLDPVQAKIKIAATGTPIVNRPIEFFSTLKFLDPQTWTDKMSYAKRYCAAERNNFGWDMTGASNLEELQKRLRSTIMIRRLKDDVLKDLPPKIRQVIELNVDNKSRKQLKAERDWFDKLIKSKGIDENDFEEVVKALNASQMVDFENASTIRKETALAKLPLVVEHLEDAIDSSDKVVVFCWHREVAWDLHQAFAGRAVMYIGGMSQKQKDEAENRFNNDPKVNLFIGNIEAAGVGLTLTVSSHVVFAELDYVPGNISQAEDRCHRYDAKGNIYKHDSIIVQHLVLEGSVDAYMAKMVVEKQNVIDKALDNDDDLKILEEILS